MTSTVIAYEVLLKMESVFAPPEAYRIFAQLCRNVREFERDDPDGCYANVEHRWVLCDLPGIPVPVEITGVPDPDIVMRHSMDLPVAARAHIDQHLVDKKAAFRDAAYKVLARHHLGEDVGALIFTFADLVAGDYFSDAATYHLVGLLYARMREMPAKVEAIPYLFFIPSCMRDGLPRPVEVVDVPHIDHVKCHVLQGIREGQINLRHILNAQK